MEEKNRTIKVSQHIRAFLDNNSDADMERPITFSATDALMLFSCFQKIVIINEITTSLLSRIEASSQNDTRLLKHHTKELQGQAEGFILSALDKFTENNK